MTASRPIGVFDSGVGGLTVLRALHEHLPQETLIYLGDTARLPYGTKSPETVSRYAVQAARILVERGVKLLVVACNTASAHALADLRAEFAGVPVVGVIEPGAAAACEASPAGRIVVIATESTVRAGAYERAIRRLRPDAQVLSKACSLFVPLAEEGLVEGEIARLVARHYLAPLFSGDGPDTALRADCLVLGCTHFPALRATLREVVGDKVTLIDSATTAARMVERELRLRGLLATGPARPMQLLATDAPERFARVAGTFLPWQITPDDVELVDLIFGSSVPV